MKPVAEKRKEQRATETNGDLTAPATERPVVLLAHRQNQEMWSEYEEELSVTDCTICPNDEKEFFLKIRVRAMSGVSTQAQVQGTKCARAEACTWSSRP